MDKRQAERLRAEKRRRRRMKKIRGYTLMAICAVIIVALVVFAVKGIVGFVAGSDSDIDASSDIISSDVTGDPSSDENKDSSSDTVDESSSDSTDESSSDSSSAEEPSSSEEPAGSDEPENNPANAQPVGEKPEQSWSTMLVNQWSYMPEGYVPEVRPISYDGVSPLNNQFDVRAADALEKMLADARTAGYNMYLVSAYRSHNYQVNLFNNKVQEYKDKGYDDTEAYNQASQWVAIPGTSEHCTGLAADIVSSTWYNSNSDLTHEFEDTEHFDWLYSHCADYGFILRYPKNREATTGITYEPWHYRYVGVDAAKYIMSNNITLEEFCAE